MNAATSVLKEYLPSALYSFLCDNPPPEELRMRRGCRVLLKKNGISIPTALICTDELMNETLARLTNRSFYSHEESIRNGYISLPGGIRAGVCGEAVCDRDKVLQIKKITSVVIRIPRRIPHIDRPLTEILKKDAFQKGALIYSLPGVGKTTVLRELACTLSGEYHINTALLDCRGELSAGLEHCDYLSVFLNYPKNEALSIAIRTMAPEMIILDEIGFEETDQLLSCGVGGIPAVASIHAGSLEELKKRSSSRKLLSSGIFSTVVRLERRSGQIYFTFHESKDYEGLQEISL